MTATKKNRTPGAYSVQGQKVSVLYTKDKHKLWSDLFSITESQISSLKTKVDSGGELDPKDLQKLDSCYSGMKKLLEIEAVLKSDAISSMSNDDLLKISRKIIRERPKTDDSES
jgi:hypothetical protein